MYEEGERGKGGGRLYRHDTGADRACRRRDQKKTGAWSGNPDLKESGYPKAGERSGTCNGAGGGRPDPFVYAGSKAGGGCYS